MFLHILVIHMRQHNSTMKAVKWTNQVLLFALGKTTTLPREGTNFAEFLRFQCTF